MNRFYQGDWMDSIASRFVDELPDEFIKKNNIFQIRQKVILNSTKILNLKKIRSQMVKISKKLNDK